MPFTYSRTVRLSDTDAAGVIYFTQVLSICHEAYEESLIQLSQVNIQHFVNNPSSAIPIVEAQVNFFRPIFCGDKLIINLTPEQINDKEFEVIYEILTCQSPQKLAQAKTRHVCINPENRQRALLPEIILQWLVLF